MGRIHVTYRYDMGFLVDGKPIPDPFEFSGTESALDTSAERDATGYLHRAMVATKHPYKIKWQNIEWEMINQILAKVKGDRFQFTCPDPANGLPSTRECYAGDREWNCRWSPEGKEYIGDLSFSVIEY